MHVNVCLADVLSFPCLQLCSMISSRTKKFIIVKVKRMAARKTSTSVLYDTVRKRERVGGQWFRCSVYRPSFV